MLVEDTSRPYLRTVFGAVQSLVSTGTQYDIVVIFQGPATPELRAAFSKLGVARLAVVPDDFPGVDLASACLAG